MMSLLGVTGAHAVTTNARIIRSRPTLRTVNAEQRITGRHYVRCAKCQYAYIRACMDGPSSATPTRTSTLLPRGSSWACCNLRTTLTADTLAGDIPGVPLLQPMSQGLPRAWPLHLTTCVRDFDG